MATISRKTKKIIRDNVRSIGGESKILLAVEEELNKHDMDTQQKIQQVETNITQAVTGAITTASNKQTKAINDLTKEIRNLINEIKKT